ncbi:MAG: purine-nucleoside phosphorylase, partial [Elusimicrobiales bacterium]
MEGEKMYKKIVETADFIKRKIGDIKPNYLVIMGSGLKDAIPELEDIKTLSYSEIPNFPLPSVKGHIGELIYGRFKDRNLVIMRGRFHYYEGYSITFLSFPIRLFNYLGVTKLLVTAAVGSLKRSIKPGDIIILSDHINLMNTNPLIGNYHEKFGEMFVDMSEPYKKAAIKEIEDIMKKRKMRVKKGVYVAVSGPCYETEAEARMYRMIGGDVIGMSVVPEVISARQLRMDVFGVCWVSNYV